MTVERAIADISTLPIDDQIRVLNAIWDSLPAHSAVELTDEQRAEFDRRLERHRQDPNSSLTESELRQRLRDARS